MKHNDEISLVQKFNRKDVLAFGKVYSLLYKELFVFTSKLLNESSLEPNDVLHDNFIKLFEAKNQEFTTLDSIKAFMYVCIRNYIYNIFSRDKRREKFSNELLSDDNYLLEKVSEVETFSLMQECEKLLPTECAKAFKLHLDGYSVKEIAQMLGKSVTTIYTQNQDAITILKKRLTKDKFYMIFFILYK